MIKIGDTYKSFVTNSISSKEYLLLKKSQEEFMKNKYAEYMKLELAQFPLSTV